MISHAPIRFSFAFAMGLLLVGTAFVSFRVHELRQWLDESDRREFAPASTQLEVMPPEPLESLQATLLAPQEIHMLAAGSSSPIQSTIPQYTYSSTKHGLTLWARTSGEGVMAPGSIGFRKSDHTELKKFGFVERNGKLLVVLVSDESFEVQLRSRDTMVVEQVLKFDNHQPWTDPVSHVEYVDGYLAVRGSLDEIPWNVTQRWLRVYDVESGRMVHEQDAPADLPVLPPWQWPAPTMDHTTRCNGTAGELQMSGPNGKIFTVPTCQGELSSVTFVDRMDAPNDPRAELKITRRWDAAIGTVTCAATLRPPRNIEFRLRHDESSVTIFGRTEQALYAWQYDLDCNLADSRTLPARVLDLSASAFVYSDSWVPKDSEVTFATDPEHWPAGRDSALIVTDDAGRISRHNLVAPLGLSAGGFDEDRVWWAYASADDWYVYVVDRDTRRVVFSETGSHSESVSPLSGLKVNDGYLTVKIGQFLMMGRLPVYETRVYSIDSGALVANVEGMR